MLLLNKIRSLNGSESLRAVALFEACIKNCGENLINVLQHSEVVRELVNLICKKVIFIDT